MNDLEPGLSPPSAKAIRLEAAMWHDRREREGWTQNDEIAFQSWLNEAAAHKVAFLRVDAAWARADRLNALRDAGRDAPFKSLSRFRSAAIRITVAGITLAAVGFAAVPYFSKSHIRTYSTAVGGHKVLALSDGSRVELNTDSSLRVEITGKRRVVWLDRGEAYFKVRADAVRPFIVKVGDHRITDIGTAFDIRRDEDRLKVFVLEGRIQLAGEGNGSRLLKDGDVAVANGSAVIVNRETERALANELGWQRGVLVFDNVTLAEAASEFNRYSHDKIVIPDPSAAKITIGATLPSNDVSAFVRVAQKIFGLHAERRGDNIVISR